MKRTRSATLVLIMVFAAQGLFSQSTQGGNEPMAIPEIPAGMEVATLGGGCFWCIEAVYERVEGVVNAYSGYAGGTIPNPEYREVSTGATGHAEVVQIVFDPSIITYEQILNIFWHAHDPTTPNRQGADVGTQYRSIILYQNDEQRKIAQESIAAAQPYFDDPIVTEVEPLTAFYPAEKYHQDYYDNNVTAGYCRVVISPKLAKLGLSARPNAEKQGFEEIRLP